MSKDNQLNPEVITESENSEATVEKRTISTARLERLREAASQTVKEFIESLLEYEVSNPSDSFQESISKFGETISAATKSSPKKEKTEKEPDWDKLTVEHLIDNNIYPITGILNRIQASRKYQGDHIYSVNVEQGPGTKAQTIADLTDLSAVRIEINGVLLKVIDVLSDVTIPNRVYKQGYQSEDDGHVTDKVENAPEYVDDVDSDSAQTDYPAATDETEFEPEFETEFEPEDII